MSDQSAEMTGGESEEPALSSERAASEQQALPESGGNPAAEAGPEDEEMTSGSHDLSSSANHSPGSVTGSMSTKSSDNAGKEAHKEVMNTVAEMKKRLPSDKRSRSKASTIEALHYALNCVKQVQANSEYYKLLMSNGQEERQNATVCTLEELERVTSEHTLKNTDSFVVVFSLSSCRVLYASEQAPSILCCKRKFLESAKFVELLFHQDVNVFYSHTAQPHLPPWSNSHTAGVLFDSAQVKSFFCRIRGGKDREGEMRYNPFRITPYLLKVQGTGGEEEEPCCLALAERIISGYEAPRIPMDKRIFTTTHSPGCVFLEVDDRAVPLLGYLPQDLIGTSLLTCIHPDDRPLMLSMHRKVLKYAGQPPFEHSPVRLRCQNGDYITLDTSWSSFINPWSRKVAFIIGRHKVRTSPLNEDVFAARTMDYNPVTHEEIKDLQAKIYKLFLQPVHNNGSSGYGSLGSNGSHEHYISVASSSDSNGNLWEDTHREPMTMQQLCADVNRVKSWGQQAYFDSTHKVTILVKPPPAHMPPAVTNPGVRDPEPGRKQTHIPSYQQINCVDNIIRYLESCTGSLLKRKSESHLASSSSSTSEDDKPAGNTTDTAQASSDVVLDSGVSVSPSAAAVVGAPLTDLTLSTKAMSVVSVTSQCSYSSTIVHVPQPESEVTALEDAPMGSEPTEAPPASAARPAPGPAAEERRYVGLTKEVLSAHTQKEEQEYVDRFKHRILQSPYSSYLQLDNSSMAHSHQPGDYLRPISAAGLNRSRRGKPRHKRPKPQGSSDSYVSPRRPPNSSWPSSESSQPQHMAAPFGQASQLKPPFFPMMPAPQPSVRPDQLQRPPNPPQPPPPPPQQQANLAGPTPVVYRSEQTQVNYNFSVMQAPNVPIQMDTLPNFNQNFNAFQPVSAPGQSMNPYVAPVMAVLLPNYPAFTPGYPSVFPLPAPSVLPQVPLAMTGFTPAPVPFPQPPHFQSQLGAQSQPQVLLPCSPRPGSSVGEEEETAGHRALFSSSRSSSPLQLNLLQEELPKPSEGQSSNPLGESLHEQRDGQGDGTGDSGTHDAQSTSSELLDLLLQEDARSGTGSNASGSGSGESGSLGSGSGSGSNGTSTSHTGSSNSSKYFASNDSSDTSRKARKSQDAPPDPHGFESRVENSLWTMIQHTPEHVMMTYQIHTRDQSEVLAEDREKLRVLQPLQPWFTAEQREELAEVHPWIKQQTIPPELETEGCVGCNSGPAPGGPPHLPHTASPDSSSPLDTSSPQQSPLLQGASVDT